MKDLPRAKAFFAYFPHWKRPPQQAGKSLKNKMAEKISECFSSLKRVKKSIRENEYKMQLACCLLSRVLHDVFVSANIARSILYWVWAKQLLKAPPPLTIFMDTYYVSITLYFVIIMQSSILCRHYDQWRRGFISINQQAKNLRSSTKEEIF